MEKVWDKESGGYPKEYNDKYAYDIFGNQSWYQNSSLIGANERSTLIHTLDLTTPTERKIVAMSTNELLTRDVPTVDTLDQYLLSCVYRGALNDKEYYSPGGLFERFSAAQETVKKNIKKDNLMNRPTTTGLDPNGNLIEVPLTDSNNIKHAK